MNNEATVNNKNKISGISNRNYSTRSYSTCPRHCENCTNCREVIEDNRFNDGDHNIGGSLDTVYICTIDNDYCSNNERLCPKVTRGREVLTNMEFEIYDLIKFFYEHEGYSPGIADIANECNISNEESYKNLKIMENKGYIKMKNRRILLTGYKIRLERISA